MILVYQDEGVSSTSLKQVIYCLREVCLLNKIPIRLVDHRFITHQSWEKDAQLLIFPGGRDKPYQEKLKGKGNEKIRDFVNSGGAYLGICAGAYYGSSHIEFEKGQPLEVCETRELGFFPGKAIGPAYGLNLFKYHSEAGARTALLQWQESIHDFSAYFNGGCFFYDVEAYPQIQTLARFKDLPSQPAAIISCNIDKGIAILSGVHPEFAFFCPSTGVNYNKNLWEKILSVINDKIKILIKY